MSEEVGVDEKGFGRVNEERRDFEEGEGEGGSDLPFLTVAIGLNGDSSASLGILSLVDTLSLLRVSRSASRSSASA